MHACVCVCVCGLTHWQVGFSCTGIKLFIQHGIMLLPLMYGDYIPQHVWLIGKIPPKNCNIKFGMCSGNSPLEVIALDCMFTTTNRLPACPQRLSEQQGPDLSALQQCGKLSWQYYKIEHITPLYCCVFLSYNSGHLFKCHYTAMSVRCYWSFTDGRDWTRRLICNILSAAGQQSRRINTHSSSSCHDTTSSVVYIANLVFPTAVFTSWMLFPAFWSIFNYKYFILYKKFCFLFMQLTVHVLHSSRAHRTIQLSNIYVRKAHKNGNTYWY